MGDGKVRRIAIIINGDNSDKHLGNVERASKLFEDKEYQTHVVSTEKPSTSVDSFTKINQANLSKLLAKLRGKIDDDDEIVIYVTGHGDSKGNGCIEIPGKCLKQNSAQIRRLFNLKYGKRTVIMSQCFSGNWAEKFKNDPNTLFMSAGSKGETVCCEDFDPHLLSNDTKIPDQNNDGTITWKERYQYAISHKQTANTTYIAGTEYKDTGLDGKKTEPARHSGTTHRTSTPAALKSLTKRLKPGEVAVVKVSAPHCPPCVAYKPKFEEMAKADGGKNLFITIPNGDKEFWSKLGEAGYPTVFLIDHTGKTVQVQDRNKPLAERYKLAGIQWKDKEYCLKQIKEAGYDLGAIIPFIDPSFWGKKDFALKAVKLNGMALKYVPPKLQTKELVLEAVKQEGWALRHAGKFRNDHDVAREAVSNNGRAIKFVHPRIRLAHPRNKRVRDIVMLATKNDGYAPLYAHSKCFDDPDIVLTATQNKPDTIRHASSKLLRKKEFILKLLEVAPKAFEHIPKRYLRGHLKDPDIVLAAIKQRGSSLEMVKGNPLWKKSDFCLKALANNKVSHRYVDKSLLEEESFVIKALKKSPYIYDLLPEKFKGRRDLALLSVQSGGPIPEKYAKDEEFLLAFIAVKGKPVMRMITRARPDLGPTNRAFILRALKTNGNLLRDLKGYQNDREAVLIAIRSRPEAIQYVSQELMQKPGFIEMAKRTSPEIINHLK